MNDIILCDNMKKESRIFLVPMILFFVLAALFPIVAILKDFSVKALIIGELVIVLWACLFLYGFLYTKKYNITITNEQIQLKTLFRTVLLNFSDIKEYSYKRYMKSVFYQFKILYLDKKVLINIRYYEALDEILKNALLNNHKNLGQNE
ncbi:MAG: hypothetical protein J1G38_03290 [Clostridiales bacterium]|nr:hypothetical protein [Clostridiales bacterium]